MPICELCKQPIEGQVAESRTFDSRTGEKRIRQLHPECKRRIEEHFAERGIRPIYADRVAREN